MIIALAAAAGLLALVFVAAAIAGANDLPSDELELETERVENLRELRYRGDDAFMVDPYVAPREALERWTSRV